MGAALTFLGLAALGSSGYHVARRWFGLPAGLPATLGAVVLGWTWLTVGMIVLGSFGWIGRGPILGWTAIGVLPMILDRIRSKAIRADSVAEPPAHWSIEAVIALGLAVWAGVVLLMPSLLLPVKVVSDGPIYHLYFAAKWWKAGRLDLIPTPFGESAAPYFPAVGDLWLTWLFTLWGGDRTAKVGQSPFLVVAALTVYATTRRLGARPSSALIATVWFATVSPLLIFSFEPNVDTLFVAGYSLAVYFAIRYGLGDDDLGSLALACLAAGAAWGTKAPGVVFIPPLLVLFGLLVLRRNKTWPGRLRLLAVVLLVPMVNEGYWLARNAWLTGNPLYPLHMAVFGRPILAGWFGPEAMPTSPYYIPRSDWRAAIDLILSVFDPRLMPLWVLGIASPFFLPRKECQDETTALRIVSALTLLNILLYWIVIPYRTQQRFLLHSVALAAIPLGVFLDRSRSLRIVAVVATGLHVLTPQGWPWGRSGSGLPWDLSPRIPNTSPSPIPFLRDLATLFGGPDRTNAIAAFSVGLGSIAAAAAIVWAIRGRSRRWLVPGACFVGLMFGQGILALPPPEYAVLRRFPAFQDYLRGWVDLDLRSGKSGTRIAYAGTNLPYYLMGEDFRNEVKYVPIDAHREWLLHDYHREASTVNLPTTWPDTRPGWDRLRPDYASWLDNLRSERIRLLVTARADPHEGRHNPIGREGFTIERVWADAHPERFALLYADPLFRIYGLKNPR